MKDDAFLADADEYPFAGAPREPEAWGADSGMNLASA